MAGFLRRITDYGTDFAKSKSERRNIILANYTSLIGSAALILLVIALYVFYGYSPGMFWRLAAASIFFLTPLLLNKSGFIVASRVLLCWLTPIFVFGISILDLKSGEQMSSSSFVGLRLFLLAGFCFPFLFFNLQNKFLLILGLLIPIVSIIFFDSVFSVFDVSYLKNPIHDQFYEFSNVRAFIAMLAIGSSLFFLKSVVEKNEQMNLDLLLELEEKNILIQQQAEAEVFKLNKKLNTNLEMLQLSEHRYRSLFEQASDFIAILDFDGNFIDANESWRTTFGYSKEELAKVKIEDLIDPEELKFRPVVYDELQRGNHVFSQRRMMRKNKAIIEVESNAKKLQEGKMLVIARDVTNLREAQRQIQLSEAKFRGAFEFSAIGMALVSTTGNWLKVNKALCDMVGYSEDELLLLNVRDITVSEESDEGYVLQQKLLKGERDNFQGERRYIHRNGSIIWVNLNISLVKDTSKSPLYFVAQIEDITAEKKAEEKLILNEANLNATINNTDLMIWSVDRNFNLLMFNNQFETYVKKHYGTDVEIGKRVVSAINHADDEEMNNKWVGLALRALGGERFTFEETRFAKDFQYSLSPIMENSEVIGVSIFADNVTERRARDRELAEANKKIGELRLMALRSVMSPHFIFNVLNSIQYFIAKNDRLNAINYLSMFSKLVRSILTHSVNNKISLSEEIELLKHYIQLEMVRFENKFTFSITVQPDIEPESLIIPSLLVQPYVENAILHGLYNKSSPGELSIRIYEKDDLLTFEIEDNGIGREAAMKLRLEKFPSHNSMGLNITEERLKLINLGQQAAFEIEDLKDENGPSGTRVKIMILLNAVK
jgi:PAS domain S-box-containing protein